MRHLAVFLAVAVADWFWTKYTLAVSGGLPVWAGCYSAATIVVGGYVTLSYIRDRRYLIPAALGAFIGTWLSVRG